MGVAYFGLVAALSVAMWAADRPLEDLRTPPGRSVVEIGLAHTARPTTTVCGPVGTGCAATSANPASRYMAASSGSV